MNKREMPSSREREDLTKELLDKELDGFGKVVRIYSEKTGQNMPPATQKYLEDMQHSLDNTQENDVDKLSEIKDAILREAEFHSRIAGFDLWDETREINNIISRLKSVKESK